MIYTIAETLASKIKPLDCVDRWGGLTTPITTPQNDNEGNLIKNVTFPVSCYVDNGYDAWDNGTPYNYYDIVTHNGSIYRSKGIQAGNEPPNETHWEFAGILDEQDCTDVSKITQISLDSKYKSVLFFEDNSGAQWARLESPKGRIYVFNFNLRLIGWLNLARLGGATCNYAGSFVLHLISLLYGKQNVLLPEIPVNSTDIAPVANIEVKSISQVKKDVSIFSRYSFLDSGYGMFLYPYDYFAMDIRGEFMVNSSCISAFTCAAGIDCPEL